MLAVVHMSEAFANIDKKFQFRLPKYPKSPSTTKIKREDLKPVHESYFEYTFSFIHNLLTDCNQKEVQSALCLICLHIGGCRTAK